MLALDLVVNEEMKSGQSVSLQDCTHMVHDQTSLSFLLCFHGTNTYRFLSRDIFIFFVVYIVLVENRDRDPSPCFCSDRMRYNAKVCQKPAPDVPILPRNATMFMKVR
jgi:hypothetical protein